MMLKAILHGCDFETGNLSLMDTDVSGIAYDSRDVKEGYLFIAIKGEKFDGHDFIGDAIKKGATAVAAERDRSDISDEYIFVRNGRKALACISNNFYEKPSEHLILTAVTGTNGKTTTTYILKSILETWDKKVGLIGTIQYMIKDKVYPALHTTPEAPEFQQLLSDMVLAGCTHAVSEVSSHALAQYRVDSTVFRTAVFTNLTRDHLDFHKTMEDYFRAKERLFRELLNKDGTAVLNFDDTYGRRLDSQLRTSHPALNLLTYGFQSGAEIRAADAEVTFKGLQFKVFFRGRSYWISSPLMGIPNVYNILSAAAAAIALGIPWETILEGIRRTGNIAGRFERVDAGQGFLCIVDYAHTEDALERLILTARELIKQSVVISRQSAGRQTGQRPPLLKKGKDGVSPRVITVFGCGGDRDKGKRPRMGEVATRLSDFVIITSDNPRSEDPSAVIRDIEGGVINRNYAIKPDRREAIQKAVEAADAGDIVLVAGKGHEDYQEIMGVRYPFSDREILRAAIKGKGEIRDSKCKVSK